MSGRAGRTCIGAGRNGGAVPTRGEGAPQALPPRAPPEPDGMHARTYKATTTWSLSGQAQNAAGNHVALDLRGPAHHALGPAVQIHLEPGVVAAVDRRAADRQG